MEWIKTKFDRFMLLLAALILLVVSALLILKATSFAAQFELPPMSGSAKLPQPDYEKLTVAMDRLATPKKWEATVEDGRLLLSRPYIEKDGVLIDPTLPDSPQIHPPVDNIWLINNRLPIKDPTVLQQDQDGDGFENLFEWTHGQTNPRDPNSHPDYVTKLYFRGIDAHPFNLIFRAITSKGVYQIDALDSSQPTQFLEIGDMIVGSDFELKSIKEIYNPLPSGIDEEKHELTIENTKTGESVILVIRVPKNVGKDDVILSYQWKGDEEIRRRVDQTFTLKPEENVQYKVLEILGTQEQARVSRLSDGKEFTIAKKP